MAAGRAACFLNKMKVLAILLALVTAAMALPRHHHHHELELEGKKFSWQSADYGAEFDKPLCSHFDTAKKGVSLEMKGPENDEIISLPLHFDARKHWAECKSIGHIWDQAFCGSCWAMAVATAITDRTCIRSGGKFQQSISPDDLTTCCLDCGDGCNGGFATRAWNHWVLKGLVTGGPYGSKGSCKPYEIKPHGLEESAILTPTCKKKCDPSYNKTYEQDLHFGSLAYTTAQDARSMQVELLKNGPLTLFMKVPAKFKTYKSGIFMDTTNHFQGGHAVKLIGWGEEHGVPYWTIANSWGKHWGEHGTFRIVRGINNCFIEMQAAGGIAEV